MLMKILAKLGCLFLLTSAMANAASTISSDDLRYQNQPIDARCFESDGAVSLNDCTHNNTSNEKVSGQNKSLIDKGYIGADYVSTDKDKFPAGYSYYKIIGNVNGKYIVYTINSGGGSGEFTAVKLVKRNNDQLQIQSIKSGDRCNGGVSDVELHHDMLAYRVSVTPYDLIDLSGHNAMQFQAYDDIAACAACCIGKAVYEANFSNDAINENFLGIKLEKDYQQDAFNGNKQICFNKVLIEFAKGKQSLTSQELKQFVTKLDDKCR